MKKINKKEGIIVAGLVIVLALILGVVAVNKMANDKVEREIVKENIRVLQVKIAYETCVDDAYDQYFRDWDKQCDGKGLKDDCSLPKYNADSVEEGYEKDRDTCLDIYKIDLK